MLLKWATKVKMAEGKIQISIRVRPNSVNVSLDCSTGENVPDVSLCVMEVSYCYTACRTCNKVPSEEESQYVRPLYEAHCSRSPGQKLPFPIVSMNRGEDNLRICKGQNSWFYISNCPYKVSFVQRFHCCIQAVLGSTSILYTSLYIHYHKMTLLWSSYRTKVLPQI